MREVPVIDIAIELKSAGDHARLEQVLAKLGTADLSLRWTLDAESGQVILSGSSEQHLDEAVDRLKVEVPVRTGAPQLAYRETITRAVEHDYTHKTQSGGSGQFARIRFRIEPNKAGAGFEFKSQVTGGNLPEEYIPGVEKGVMSVMRAGPIIGFPIVDVRFTLTDGACHDVDSSVLAFEIAARAGFRQAIENAGPKVLEPIMDVTVTVPQACVGDVIGDLNSRRARVLETREAGADLTVVGKVPMANMLGYVNSLRALSKARGTFELTFSHYEPVPGPLDPDGRFPPAMAMRA